MASNAPQRESLTHPESAALDFVLTLRKRWADTVYPALHDEYRERVGAGPAPATRAEAARLVHDLELYPWFAWLERGSQKMLWRSANAAVGAHLAPVTRPAQPLGRLELDPALALPDWYTAWDIHVQPGGVWRNAASAQVYELGAQLVMLRENDDYLFHRAFAETALPPRDYRCIVDLGCGFGKSTWPLKRAHPQAEVIGVDLAAPCLELAHQRSEAQGLAITYLQRNACETGLPAGSADLVTSTMLLHEMPPEAIAATLREAARLLAPGGVLRMLDFQFSGQPFRDVAFAEHGVRNNEPFLPGLCELDMAALCAQAGLRGGQWVAFDERGAGRLPTAAWPERPEWHFPWAVLEAERAA